MQVWIQKYDEEMGAAEQIYQEELAQTNQVLLTDIPAPGSQLYLQLVCIIVLEALPTTFSNTAFPHYSKLQCKHKAIFAVMLMCKHAVGLHQA